MTRPPAILDSLEARPDGIAARLRVGDLEHRISYRVPGVPVEQRYEPFLVAALPIAMARARSLSVPGNVSARLLDTLPDVQRILSAWNENLRAIEVEAEAGAPPAAANGRGTASFFTAGVDSFYTALRHREDLRALVYVHGFDVALEDRVKRDLVAEAIRNAAAGLGIRLIEVVTNLRAASNRNVGWPMYHGAALASVAHLLSPRFDRVLVPATQVPRDLGPWGSHPRLDPLWSTETLELLHDGTVTRVEKLAVLARSDAALGSLRVCYQKGADYNCGRCEKCLRTMAGLRIVGALGRCATFPDRLPLRKLGRLSLEDEQRLAHARHNLAAAEALGSDPRLTRALRKLVRRNRTQTVRGPHA